MNRALGFVFVIDKPLALRYTFVSTRVKLIDGGLDVVSVMNYIYIFFNGNFHLYVGGSWPVSL